MPSPAAPLEGFRVELTDRSFALDAAGEWLALLGADLCAAPEPSNGTPVHHLSLGRSFPAGTANQPRTTISIVEPPDVDADDAAALWRRSGLAALTRPTNGVGGECVVVPESPIPQRIVAVVAAVLACAAELARRRGVQVAAELDQVETLAMLPMQPIACEQLPHLAAAAIGGAVGGAIGGSMEVADGWVYLRAVEPEQWARLLDEADHHDLAARVRADAGVLATAAAEIDTAVRTWAVARTVDQLVEIGQRARAPVAPHRDVDLLPVDEQLIARGYSDGTTAGIRVPWIVDAVGRAGTPTRRHAPTPTQPLAGLRILDLTWAWAGPFATTLLAALGAEIINVEWHPRASNLRLQPPAVAEATPDGSAWWSANQRGKRSIALNLKHPDGLAAVEALAAHCDAVMENFTPGVVDRLGVGFDALSAINPDLRYISMSAYGATGPRSAERGYGPQLYVTAGMADAIRAADGRSSEMLFPIADPISGFVGALALVAMLLQPVACHVDVSELEATAALHGLPARHGPNATTHGSAAAAPVSLRDVLDDPYLAARSFWTDDETTAMQGRNVRIAHAPWRFNGGARCGVSGAPELGRDTRIVLRDIARWDDDAIDRLVANGAALDRSSER